MQSHICVAFSRRNMYMPICSTVQLYIDRDSDDMEYTEDAIDNMILEFSGD
jgi:hypothetical protein